MTDSTLIALGVALLLLFILTAAVIFVQAQSHERRLPKLADGEVVLTPAVWSELQELRELKKRMEEPTSGPPRRHEHVWSHEPDKRKDSMGWHRYRCIVAGCPAFEWRAVKVVPPR